MKRTLCTILGVFLGAGSISQAWAAVGDQSPALTACLVRLGDNPAATLLDALQWERRGGGLDAGECAALAQMETGDIKGAAARFDALALTAGQGHATEAPSGQAARAAGYAEQAARAWLQAGVALSARKSATEALRWKPHCLAYQVLLARAQAAQNDYSASIATLANLPPQDAEPEDLVEAYILRASDQRHRGNLKGGFNDIAAALLIAPDDSGALLERGILHMRSGNLSAARQDWDRVIATSPDAHDADLARQDEDVLAADPDEP